MHHHSTRSARRAVLVAALAAAIALIAGCGSDDESTGGAAASDGGGANAEDLKFAYLTKQGDVPYFVEQVQAAKDTAEQLGVELVTQDLRLDTNLALSAMDTLISQGVDGIAIVVPDQAVGPAVIEKARQADIPLVAVDDTIEDRDGQPAPYIGLDNGAVGGQAGEAVAQLYAEAAWKDDTASVGIASVELKDLDVCNQRTEGAKEKFFAANPGFPKDQVVSVPYDGSTNAAIDAMSTVITANQEYDHWLVWSCNDAGVQGAVRALERAGVKAGDVIGVGLDGSLACDEFKRGESGFQASLYLDPKNEGKAAVQALHDFQVDGKALPEQLYFPGTYIDRENVGEVVESCK
jgi:L-arabinose transport system substrate-binding protein